MIKAPNLTLPQLESHANRLLAEYAETIGAPVPLVVPVDEIAMYHLALRIEFADLHAILGVPKRGGSAEIHGAIVFEKDTILIDKSLEPMANPGRLVRYRYSVGHEICHDRLHRSAYAKSQARKALPDIVCRENQGRKPLVEWQADYFSSFLLMPRTRVMEAWGDQRPFAFDAYKHGSRDLKRVWEDIRADGDIARTMYASECEGMFDVYSEPLSRLFVVSNQAMRIRMERLGLLKRVAVWQPV